MSDLEHIKACLDAISDPAGKGGLLTSGRASAPRLADGRAGLILDVTGLSLDVRDALNAEVEAKLKALPGVEDQTPWWASLLGWGFAAVIVVAAVVLLWQTGIGQALRAALNNPVEALRSE